MSNRKPVAAVGLSGGVDSSIAAWRLQREGWDVIGLTMSTWDGTAAVPDGGGSGCFGPGEVRQIDAARRAAERLGIEHRVVPVAGAFRHEVLDAFRREYRAGRTPNPCVTCNQRIKFGALLDGARAAGAEFDCFATGHYARTVPDEETGRTGLLRGADREKDQSYFLSRLEQNQLAQVRFPLGSMTKAEVKALARDLGWTDTADRSESQDFVAADHYDVLFRREDAVPGDIVTRDGRVMGRHRGLFRYTIGQRKGLGLGGGGTPWHVLEIDAANNRIVVGPREGLRARGLTAGGINFVSRARWPDEPVRCEVQIRQRHRAAAATVSARPDGRLEAVFDEFQTAVTPGQIAVFYDGERVLASGVIESAVRAHENG